MYACLHMRVGYNTIYFNSKGFLRNLIVATCGFKLALSKLQTI